MKGDRVEIVVDAGDVTKTYDVTATRAGRRVEVVSRRGLVEVSELTRGGATIRTARFMASRVIAVVEHPVTPGRGRRTAGQGGAPATAAARASRLRAEAGGRRPRRAGTATAADAGAGYGQAAG